MSNRFQPLRDEQYPPNPWKVSAVAKPVVIGRKLEGSLPDSDYLIELSRIPSRNIGEVPRIRLEVFESKSRLNGVPQREDVYYGTGDRIVESFAANFTVKYANKARWEVRIVREFADSALLQKVASDIERLF